MPNGGIIVGGESVACRAPVRSWHESGLRYAGLRKRKTTRAVVNHWTGAENPPASVFHNMGKRKCSVHFVVAHDGAIWQFADADDLCSHCRGANEWSVGIEIVNRGSETGVPTRGVVRELRREIIHDRPVAYAAFLEPQIEAAVALNEALCSAYGLPFEVPHLAGDIYPRAMSDGDLARVRGCIPHYFANPGKYDCGMDLLRRIHARGQALAVS